MDKISVPDLISSCISRTGVTSILLAVSGGCDSLCMLHAFAEIAPAHGLKLAIAHINHNLRPTAQRDADFVATLAAHYKLPCFIHTVPTGGLAGSDLENRARDIRYAFLHEIMQAHGYEYAATAHSADDQAETLLMRAVRGSGGRGLAGIHAHRADGIIRPLLSLRRRDIEAWMRECGFPWMEDESNAEDCYTRNRIRHHIVPAVEAIAGPQSVDLLASIAGACGTSAAFMEGVAEDWLIRNGAIFEGAPSISRKAFADEDWLVREGLSVFLRKAGIALDAGMIERLRTGADRTGKSILLAGGYRARIGRSVVEIIYQRNQ